MSVGVCIAATNLPLWRGRGAAEDSYYARLLAGRRERIRENVMCEICIDWEKYGTPLQKRSFVYFVGTCNVLAHSGPGVLNLFFWLTCLALPPDKSAYRTSMFLFLFYYLYI